MLAVVVALFVLAGCDELSARKLIQEAGQDYGDQEFEKAADKLERALKLAPDIDIAHHNLGITYSRLYKVGIETPANKEIGDKAALHLKTWLAKHPEDEKVRKLLTQLWLDSGNHEQAIAFWKEIHGKNPADREAVRQIASIYLKSGDWRQSLEWLEKDLTLATKPSDKMEIHQSIMRVAFNKLLSGGKKILGNDRIELSDIGLAAASQGLAIDDKQIEFWSVSGGLWRQRSFAQGQSWGAAIDDAEGQTFQQRARVLKDEAKKAAPPAAGAPGTPGTSQTGT